MTGIAIIVGAGASCEFGLPSGAVLQEKIKHEASFQDEAAFHENSKKFSPYSHNQIFHKAIIDLALDDAVAYEYFCKCKILKAGVKYSRSIDNFLHSQNSDDKLVDVGKLAIASCILKAEAESTIAFNDGAIDFRGVSGSQNNLPDPSDTWLAVLIKFAAAKRNFAEFCTVISNISFICFNYDRCIEHFFINVAPRIFPETEYDQQLLISSLNRPYGGLGDLGDYADGKTAFGAGYEVDLLSASKRIRTFTEGIESKVIADHIKGAFLKASKVIFLGYGFVSLNNDLLFEKERFEIRYVYGTTYGMHPEQVEEVQEDLVHSLLNKKTPYDGIIQMGVPNLQNVQCAELLNKLSGKLETTFDEWCQ